MKKISLKNLNLKEVEQLSREQLKKIMGGNVNDDGGCTCSCDDRVGSWYGTPEECQAGSGSSWACGDSANPTGTYSCS